MKVVTILAIYAATGLQTATADVLFYGGDIDGVNGLLSERDLFGDVRVYDDFRLSEPSLVSGVFGSFYDLHNDLPTLAYFEVRSEMQAGDGGALLASGQISVDATFLGIVGELPTWRFSGDIAPLELDPGDYWVAMALVSNQNGHCYLSTTSGANGVGEPLQNGNSFFDGVLFRRSFETYNFVGVQDLLGPGTWDFSIGVQGHSVPEPTTLLALLLWLVFRRSRNRR